jgi:hypothetical protein
MVDNIGHYGQTMLKEASYKGLRVDFRVNNGNCRNYSSLIPPLGYGLEGPGIQTRWGKRFSAPVQTGPGAPPNLLYNWYQVSIPR